MKKCEKKRKEQTWFHPKPNKKQKSTMSTVIFKAKARA